MDSVFVRKKQSIFALFSLFLPHGLIFRRIGFYTKNEDQKLKNMITGRNSWKEIKAMGNALSKEEEAEKKKDGRGETSLLKTIFQN